MIGLFVLGVLFVVFFMWIILSIILYKFINITLIENNKKKLPKYIGFPLSAFIVVFIASCFTFGWGWFVPYNLQPSYHKFKNMCKLDELPNNEEKYNKILSYFDLSLDTLDWEKLNEKIWKIPEDNGSYKRGVFEYYALSKRKEINSRLRIIAAFYSNQSPITRYNTNVMVIDATWKTRRYVLEQGPMGSIGLEWSEEYLSCGDIITKNMTPKGTNNE